MAVRVPAGTEADNFVAEDTDGHQWFVKVYRDRNTIDQDQFAVDLAIALSKQKLRRLLGLNSDELAFLLLA
ncbi:hypothetical protein AKL15_11805 [Corynebacterium glutamicum]|nr:hypothetical protein AUO96_11725 [Corynebacterium glutamicum]QDX76361.1 hypothetical protein AKL15_11805 [Corynebacterium glutamicum]QDX79138.1 hypothetical protein AKL16_11810 [Corynebacterium glutamicum]TWS33162.1 hypothetical protein AKJ19_10100 [Corynebacterium glutamicum]TWS33239.1 hypothetical protein AKJ20_10085 [Corynebacterium glutamicum]